MAFSKRKAVIFRCHFTFPFFLKASLIGRGETVSF